MAIKFLNDGVFSGDVAGTILIAQKASIPTGNGSFIGRLSFKAYNVGTTYSSGGGITAVASSAWTSTSTGTHLQFSTTSDTSVNPVNKMFLTSGGNLGVGVQFPGSRISIAGFTGSYTSGIGFEPVGTGARIYRTFINTDGSFNLDDATAAETRLTIDSAGNVGIGNTSPTNGKLVIDSTGFQTSLETGTAGDGRLNIGHFSNGAFIGTYGDDGGAADLIRFGTHSGDERMRITSAGKVGINATNVQDALDIDWDTEGVATDNSGIRVRAYRPHLNLIDRSGYTTSNGHNFQIKADGAKLQFNATSADNETFDLTRMVIDKDGYVGIGTASPSTVLDVRGGGANTLPATTGTTPSTGTRFRLANIGSASAVLDFGISTGGKSWLQSTDRTALNTTYPFLINPNGGNVGIGTDSPLNKLFVSASTAGDYAGFIENTNSTNGYGLVARTAHTGTSAYAFAARAGTSDIFVVRGDGNVGIGTTSPGYKLDVESTTTPLHLNRTGGATALIGLDIAGVNRGLIGATTTAAFVSYSTAAASLMTILNTGKVGIGTDSPQQLLHINNTSGDFGAEAVLRGSTSTGTPKSEIAFKRASSADGAEMVLRTSNSSGTIQDVMTLDTSGNATFAGTVTVKDGALFYGANAIAASAESGQYVASFGKSTSGSAKFAGNITVGAGDSSFVGNVGIGTISPDSKLHVESTSATGANFILESTHSGGIPLLDLKGAASAQIRYKDELNVIQGRIDFVDSGTFNFIDVPNNKSTLYLKTGGNVGIGETSPSAKLDASGTYRLQLRTDDAIPELRSITVDGTAFKELGLNGSELILKTSSTERMRISSGGNVGIGVAPFASSLNSTTLDLAPVASVWGFGNSAYLNANAYYNSGWLYKSTATAGVLQIDGNSLTFRQAVSGTANAAIAFDQPFVIDADGNVGIGTTSPTQAKLCVSGSTFQTGDLLLSHSNTYSPEIKMTNSTHTIGIDYQSNETLRFITRSGVTTVPITFQMRAGTITATNFILSSDERKKTKVKDLSRDSISVNWKSFEMKENKGEYRAGVIAQELEEKHPEFVRTDDEGMKSVAYIDLLIAKIAELEARLEKAGI